MAGVFIFNSTQNLLGFQFFGWLRVFETHKGRMKLQRSSENHINIQRVLRRRKRKKEKKNRKEKGMTSPGGLRCDAKKAFLLFPNTIFQTVVRVVSVSRQALLLYTSHTRVANVWVNNKTASAVINYSIRLITIKRCKTFVYSRDRVRFLQPARRRATRGSGSEEIEQTVSVL